MFLLCVFTQTAGLGYDVPAGRRDGRVSIGSETLTNLPPPSFDVNQLTQNFANKGLTQEEMVTLSGILLPKTNLSSLNCYNEKKNCYNEFIWFVSLRNVNKFVTQSLLRRLTKKCYRNICDMQEHTPLDALIAPHSVTDYTVLMQQAARIRVWIPIMQHS